MHIIIPAYPLSEPDIDDGLDMPPRTVLNLSVFVWRRVDTADSRVAQLSSSGTMAYPTTVDSFFDQLHQVDSG
jgi:hypothetical protein